MTDTITKAIDGLAVLRSIELDDLDKRIVQLEEELMLLRTLHALRKLQLQREDDTPRLATDLDKAEQVDRLYLEQAEKKKTLPSNGHRPIRVTKRPLAKPNILDTLVDCLKEKPLTASQLADRVECDGRSLVSLMHRNPRIFMRTTENNLWYLVRQELPKSKEVRSLVDGAPFVPKKEPNFNTAPKHRCRGCGQDIVTVDCIACHAEYKD